MKKYRVWTKDCDGSYSIMTSWLSYYKCRKMIVGRWGHWPPFAYISRAIDFESFIRYNGE